MGDTTSKKILYVEDEPFVAELVKSVLEEVGNKVEIAIDGEEGLNKIRNNYYDIVLLDIMLPKMDGLTLLETIAKENIKQGKIVMFTNLIWDGARQAALQKGATDYIVKSEVKPNELSKKINAL